MNKIRRMHPLMLFFLLFTALSLLLGGMQVHATSDPLPDSETSTETSPSADDEPPVEGVLINDQATFLSNSEPLSSKLFDGKESSYKSYDSLTVEISSTAEIGGLYIKFDKTPPKWTLTSLESTQACGNYGFLHEYVEISEDGITALTLVFEEKVAISDIYLLSKGTLPDFVQVWRPAEGPADLLVQVAHSDDDQLFFAGSIPDAVARGAEVQVCYFTNHWNTHTRPHELLNGLYTCGVDRYPVIGELPDNKRVDDLLGMLAVWQEKGFSYDIILGMQVELIRKYRPQIVLAHDINGEYGHGAHRLSSQTMRDAILEASNPARFPESAELYGVWDVPKTYIHLWVENKIDFELDIPLDHFGGKTAYEVSQEAFRCHYSQHDTRYAKWLWGTEEEPVTKSTEFYKYGPRDYGLWRSTVGADTVKTDIYENIVFYADMPPVVEPPSPEPTEEPSEEPTVEPSEEPSLEPSEEPTPKPSVEPSEEPTPEPSVTPSLEVSSEAPSEPSVPTEEPDEQPSTPPAAQPKENAALRAMLVAVSLFASVSVIATILLLILSVALFARLKKKK